MSRIVLIFHETSQQPYQIGAIMILFFSFFTAEKIPAYSGWVIFEVTLNLSLGTLTQEAVLLATTQRRGQYDRELGMGSCTCPHAHTHDRDRESLDCPCPQSEHHSIFSGDRNRAFLLPKTSFNEILSWLRTFCFSLDNFLMLSFLHLFPLLHLSLAYKGASAGLFDVL